jgi:hypothetical protein
VDLSLADREINGVESAELAKRDREVADVESGHF